MDRNGITGTSGFTLIELMVSITVLLLGAITAGGLRVTTEQSAFFTEQRYQDLADARNQIEMFKTQCSTAYPGGVSACTQGSLVAVTKTVDQTIYTTTGSGSSPGAINTSIDYLKATTSTGDSCVSKYAVGASGMPNLVRVELTVNQATSPIQVVTYVRVQESR